MINILSKIKFYSLLSMCWFMVVWLVGIGTDNVKLAEIAGEVVLYSWGVGMICLIIGYGMNKRSARNEI